MSQHLVAPALPTRLDLPALNPPVGVGLQGLAQTSTTASKTTTSVPVERTTGRNRAISSGERGLEWRDSCVMQIGPVQMG